MAVRLSVFETALKMLIQIEIAAAFPQESNERCR
jgi:hypothetical protein